MQALTSATSATEAPLCLRDAGRPSPVDVPAHGKLDEVRIQLCEDDFRLAGWACLWLPDAPVTHVARERRAGPVYGEMLDWFEVEAAAAGAGRCDAHAFDAQLEASRARFAQRPHAARAAGAQAAHASSSDRRVERRRAARGGRRRAAPLVLVRGAVGGVSRRLTASDRVARGPGPRAAGGAWGSVIGCAKVGVRPRSPKVFPLGCVITSHS